MTIKLPSPNSFANLRIKYCQLHLTWLIHEKLTRTQDLEPKRGKQFAEKENVLPEKMKRNGEDFTKKENILSEMKGAGKREHFGPKRNIHC